MTDPVYQTFSYPLANRGVVARYVADRLPPGTYLDMTNLESRFEEALSSRYVISIQTYDPVNKKNLPLAGPTGPIINLGRMESLLGQTYNYAGTSGLSGTPESGDQALYRKVGDAPGGYTLLTIPSGLEVSGSRMSMVSYRPSLTSLPYIYFIDNNGLYKDNGTFTTLQQMGINPPRVLPTVTPSAGPQTGNIQSPALSGVVRGLGGQVSVSLTAPLPSNFKVGATVVIAGVTDNSFNGTFTITIINGPGIFSYVQPGLPGAVSGNGTATAQGSLTTGAGLPYDWRYTFYNDTIGLESGPSIAAVAGATLTNQNATIGITASSDPQVTHWNLYRRGGTLSAGWFFVARIPISQLTYLDNNPDSAIANDLLVVDADPPVTTNLSQPWNAILDNPLLGPGVVTMSLNTPLSPLAIPIPGQLLTIGSTSSGLSEQVRVISSSFNKLTGLWTFVADIQYAHSNGDPVSASTQPNTPMNLAAIANDVLWMAGDPNNPNILYYSLRFQPETFPVENFIEVGSPSDPIMALVNYNGTLYVFTRKKVYYVVGAGTVSPEAIPLPARHGLAFNFAWTLTPGGIAYMSQDGIYELRGGVDVYLSEQVEWIFQGRSNGPLAPIFPPDAIPANSYQLTTDEPIMAYHNHEIFVAYTAGTSANKLRRRLIYHDIYKRWRPDSVQAEAMLLQGDLGTLLISILDDSANVYLDRQNGGQDFYGYDNSQNQILKAVNWTLQTPQLDQSENDPSLSKRFKVYNEFTLDFDSQSGVVTPTLLFDSGKSSLGVVPATMSTTGRAQVQGDINLGLGRSSQNCGLLITGSTAVNPTTLYKVHIRATPEAEYRRSFDTYWTKWGTDEFKFAKQGWWEWTCADPAGITVNVYLEGSPLPTFTFTLPQALTRTTKRVRMPVMTSRLWRVTGITSAGDFQIYNESHLEVKTITSEKGYAKQKLAL